MASIESSVLKYWLRRQNYFGNGEYNPTRLRKHLEDATQALETHPQVKVKPVRAGKIRAEWLIPPQAPADSALLYIHGGGWFMGSARAYRSLVSYLAYSSGVRALSINYRLAPEHPFPAGLQDCLAVYDWLLEQGYAAGRLAVVGDSSGANLALATLLALKHAGRPLPACCVAISPATDLALTGNSIRAYANRDPILSSIRSRRLIDEYLAGHDPLDPLVSPLYGDLQGLPPLLIHVSDREQLLDDAIRLDEYARSAGVDVQLVVWSQMFHVFQMFVDVLPEARRAVRQIGEFIKSWTSVDSGKTASH
jgi:monoterpene epsilon-lactone hydrolase